MKSDEQIIQFSEIPEFQYFSNQSISYSLNGSSISESKILYINTKSINLVKKFTTVLGIPRLDDWVTKNI